jgi:hypothetical protein
VAVRKPFLIRIQPEILEGLRGWAQQEMRSLNGQIEFLLREALRRHGRTPPPTDEPRDEPTPDPP